MMGVEILIKAIADPPYVRDKGHEAKMKKLLFIGLSFVLMLFAAVSYSDTYDFGSSYWVDDYSGDPAAYTGIYSYRIYQDGVQTVEVIDAATPTISDVITAPDGVALSVQLRNGNDQVAVGDPGRYAIWTAQIPVSTVGAPVPVTTWTIRVIQSQ